MTLNMVSGTSTANNADAYQVTGAEWTSASLQWSNKPAANIRLEENISHNNKTKYQFSCLAAVQHWYDGDTTGQHENYGIMLCYNNPDIADYNSVYSADCTDANSRPSLTISYIPANRFFDVEMDGTLTLTLPDVTGTITWVTENATIATVNSAGVVTGHKAGKVDITAFVDGAEHQRFTVYVTLPNGVYRLQNSGMYLGTYGSIDENTSARLVASASAGIDYIRQLWKITYLGNGHYSIRPMHKLNMALHADGTIGTSADIVSIGIDDTYSAVSLLNQWEISASADGNAYYLNHCAVGSMSLRAENGSVSSGLGLVTGVNTGTLSVFRWSLFEIVDPPSGVILYDTRSGTCCSSGITLSIFKNVPQVLSDHNLLAVGYCKTSNDPAIMWYSTDSSVVSINENTGEFIGYSSGTVTITARLDEGSTLDGIRFTVRTKVACSLGGEFHEGNDVECADQRWKSCGYSTVYSTNPGIRVLCEDSLNTEILYFSTHGLQHLIQFKNDMVLTDDTIEENSTSRSIGNISLSNTDLCIYDACLTASNEDGTGENLCTATIAAGANCVIGWTKTIGVNDAFDWQTRFQSKLIEGYSVIEAANYANSYLYNSNKNIKSWRIYGDRNTVISGNVQSSAIIDESYVDVTTSMYAGAKYSDSLASEIIEVYFPDNELANTDSYVISRTYTSDEVDNYVVDFVVYRGYYSLNVGYSVLVEEGEIIGIRSNIGTYSANAVSACSFEVIDVEQVKAKAYEEAACQMHQMSPGYSVVSQTDELYYDITAATRYCRVFTVYETESGAVGAFETLYTIDNGENYEK